MIARALILNVGHRFLTFKGADGRWHLPAITPLPGERPLVTLRAAVLEKAGVELPAPSGRHSTAASDDFAFVLPAAHLRDSGDVRWNALQDAKRVEGVWAIYVSAILGGWEPPHQDIDVFHFGADTRTAANLAHLVVKGRKRLTVQWSEAARAKGETVPTPGLVSVVTDGFGFPICVIQTEQVQKVRFSEVDAGCALEEGEGDGSLEDWREGHHRYFIREGRELGLDFGDDTLVTLERFRVLKVLGTSDASRDEPIGEGRT